LRLNLKTPQGVEIYLRLAAGCDVVIDSFRPGVADRLGIGYTAIQGMNPAVVYCALSAFGQSGPLAARPSHDLGAQALTGTLSLTQSDGRGPSLPASPTADVALGSLGLAAIMMALFRRERSGAGDFIDMSMTDSLISWNPHIVSTVLAADAPPDLDTERLYGGAAFYNIYRTADARYLVLSGAELNFAENLLTALGRADLVRLCRAPWGPAQAPVKDFLRDTFATRSLADWDEWLADKGVCYAPVLNLHEAWQQPFFRDGGMIAPGADGIERLGTPLKFLHEPGQPSEKLAELGADTERILEQLGYDARDRAKLRDAGVC
jgi:crotonobetainyl-CoA:carnitine CoA-transferase CaiB-like acyl-CoA transferase